eukprot:490469-Prymnesium_polylepis.3
MPSKSKVTSTTGAHVCRFQISGAKYTGVPQNVSAVWLSLDNPKSVSFTWPSESSKTFSGFKSL